jgi:hypothetical protein
MNFSKKKLKMALSLTVFKEIIKIEIKKLESEIKNRYNSYKYES